MSSTGRQRQRRRYRHEQRILIPWLLHCLLLWSTPTTNSVTATVTATDAILAITLNGQITALDPNGTPLWQIEPIQKDDKRRRYQSNTSSSSSSEEDKVVRGMEPLIQNRMDASTSPITAAVRAFPGVNGRVLLQYADYNTLDTSGEELLSKMPFIDKRGNFYTGSKVTNVIAIDVEEGTIIPESEYSSRAKNAFWIGRIDYQVQISDAARGVIQAEFQMSEVVPLGRNSPQLWLLDSPSSYSTGNKDHENIAVIKNALPYAAPYELRATPDVSLSKINTIEYSAGNCGVEWTANNVSFDSPVVLALDVQTNQRVNVDFVSDICTRTSNDLMLPYPSTDLTRLPGKQVQMLQSPETLQDNVMLDQSDLDFLQTQDLGTMLEYLNTLQRKKEYIQPSFQWERILVSWVPPAVALAFVISFELGRRSRLRQLQNQRNQIGTNTISGINVDATILGYGGHGTVVYRGSIGSRPIAVKKMLKAYHASAEREMSLLISSDGHENVVRYFTKEVRGDFVYLALELCDLSLADMVVALTQRPIRNSHVMNVVEVLRGIAHGVRHIHELRIVHRDLKPQNILLARRKSLKRYNDTKVDQQEKWTNICGCLERQEYIPKISDMGLGKQLSGQQSSYGGMSNVGSSKFANSNYNESSLIGPGSVGWQAPEVMALRSTTSSSVASEDTDNAKGSSTPSPSATGSSNRVSRSVDIFSLGCIFHCVLLPGVHPFGEWYERESNIMKEKAVNIHLLKQSSPEGFDLVRDMISPDPKARLTAAQVCVHPFFWHDSKKLLFLCESSDRIELDSDGLFSLQIECNASDVIGFAWDEVLETELLSNVGRYRSYDPSSVRHCLRILRNKYHHYDELPNELKRKLWRIVEEKIGCVSTHDTSGNEQLPQNVLFLYFSVVFPKLFLHCYNVCRRVLTLDDPLVKKYDIILAGMSISATSSNKNVESWSLPTVLEKEQAVPNDSLSRVESELSVMYDEDTETLPQSANQINEDDENKPKTSNGSSIPVSSVVIWDGSELSRSSVRGWMRSELEWQRAIDKAIATNPIHSNEAVSLKTIASDPKYRTRLCNHWDQSEGTRCPMRRKNKCIFAHGPVELRVKEGKRGRWGNLVDKKGNHSNINHSGGEDTYGAARSVEMMRKNDGKWGNNSNHGSKGTNMKRPGNQTPKKVSKK